MSFNPNHFSHLQTKEYQKRCSYKKEDEKKEEDIEIHEPITTIKSDKNCRKIGRITFKGDFVSDKSKTPKVRGGFRREH